MVQLFVHRYRGRQLSKLFENFKIKMNSDNWNPDKNLIPRSYFQQSCQALRQREKKIEQLIQHVTFY